jgi:hypothetical protein
MNKSERPGYIEEHKETEHNVDYENKYRTSYQMVSQEEPVLRLGLLV